MSKRVHEEVAEKLEQRLGSDPAYRLPRIVDLAEEYGVCYATMWKAIKQLVAKGILLSKAGRKLARPGEPGSGGGAPPEHTSSVDRLFATIKQGIVDGTYQVGKPFPKSGYFVHTKGVSYLTIGQVFARLRRENLAHKIKSRWVAGPPPSGRAAPRSQGHPVVLMLTYGATEWYDVFERSFTGTFMHPFRNELQSRSVRLLPAMVFRSGNAAPDIPAGSDETRRAVSALGERYLGALFMGVHPREADMVRLMRELGRMGKPVVFFDHAQHGEDTQRELGSEAKVYHRLHLDERAAAALVLSELSKRGHRRVGIHAWELTDWGRRRSKLITETARQATPPMEVVLAQPSEECWSFGRWSRSVTEFGERFAAMTARTKRKGLMVTRRTLLDNTRSMADMLRDHAPTALIALNDVMAREYLFWLNMVGIEVPRDISLFSFDNEPASILFPISTIDFGFSELGYQAAHIFLNDIPVRTDRRRNIPGKCSFVDWGSVGPIGEHRGRFRAL